MSNKAGLPPIVFIDAQLIVIDKPAGALSVPGLYNKDSAVGRLQESLRRAAHIHRLIWIPLGFGLCAQ